MTGTVHRYPCPSVHDAWRYLPSSTLANIYATSNVQRMNDLSVEPGPSSFCPFSLDGLSALREPRCQFGLLHLRISGLFVGNPGVSIARWAPKREQGPPLLLLPFKLLLTSPQHAKKALHAKRCFVSHMASESMRMLAGSRALLREARSASACLRVGIETVGYHF